MACLQQLWHLRRQNRHEHFQFSTGFALIKGLFEGVRRDVREDFFQGKLLPVLLPFVNRYNVATFPLGPMLYGYTPVGIPAGAP